MNCIMECCGGCCAKLAKINFIKDAKKFQIILNIFDGITALLGLCLFLACYLAVNTYMALWIFSAFQWLFILVWVMNMFTCYGSINNFNKQNLIRYMSAFLKLISFGCAIPLLIYLFESEIHLTFQLISCIYLFFVIWSLLFESMIGGKKKKKKNIIDVNNPEKQGLNQQDNYFGKSNSRINNNNNINNNNQDDYNNQDNDNNDYNNQNNVISTNKRVNGNSGHNTYSFDGSRH